MVFPALKGIVTTFLFLDSLSSCSSFYCRKEIKSNTMNSASNRMKQLFFSPGIGIFSLGIKICRSADSRVLETRNKTVRVEKIPLSLFGSHIQCILEVGDILCWLVVQNLFDILQDSM